MQCSGADGAWDAALRLSVHLQTFAEMWAFPAEVAAAVGPRCVLGGWHPLALEGSWTGVVEGGLVGVE